MRVFQLLPNKDFLTQFLDRVMVDATRIDCTRTDLDQFFHVF